LVTRSEHECRFGAHSGGEGPLGRDELDSEDDFEAEVQSPGHLSDDLEASDDDDALVRGNKPNAPVGGDQAMEADLDENLEDEDL
jgi:hypothetical protein